MRAVRNLAQQVRHHNVRAVFSHERCLSVLPLATALVADEPDHRTLALGKSW